MRLRATLERALPLREGEARLSPATRSAVFRNFYIRPSNITEVNGTSNLNRSSRKAFPYQVEVVRTFSNGTKSISGGWDDLAYKDPSGIIEEMGNPEALARANRIERIGRRIKTTGASLIVGSAIVLALGVSTSNEEGSSPSSNVIPPCHELVTGQETLVPIGPEDTRAMQSLGNTVCTLADTPYLVTHQA